MTSPKDQIQALIAEIDGVLQKASPRLPWVVSGETAQQRRVLERVRNYLIALQKRMILEERPGQTGVTSDLSTYNAPYQQPSLLQGQGFSDPSSQPMMQAVAQEMAYFRSSVMQPLLGELETLRQQRESLTQEIRQLEGQRQSYVLTQQPNQQQIITEFLQVLMGRLQDSLAQQVGQSLRNVAGQSLPYSSDPMFLGAASTTQAGLPQAHSDQLLVGFDNTLRVVFDSLQRDVKAYQESLAQGVDRMHSLGQQGEMMFTALANHLAQQLGREASSYLQASTQVSDLESAHLGSQSTAIETTSDGLRSQPISPSLIDTSLKPTTGSTSHPVESAIAPTPGNLEFPYPGIELTPLAELTASIASVIDEAIASSPSSSASGADPRSQSAPNWAGTEVFSISKEVDFSGLNLGEPDFPELNLDDLELPLIQSDASDSLLSEADNPIFSGTPGAVVPSEGTAIPTTSGDDTTEIDAALKNLLDQLGPDLEEPSQPSIVDAEAQIDRLLQGASHPLTEISSVPEKQSAATYDELDSLYESLFGVDGLDIEPAVETSTSPSITVTSPPVDSGLTGLGAIAPEDVHLTQAVQSTSSGKAPESFPESLSDATGDPTLGWDLLDSTATPESNASASSPEADLLSDLSLVIPDDDLFNSLEPFVSESSLPDLGEAATRSSTDLLDASVDEINSLTDLFDDFSLTEPAAQLPEPEISTGTHHLFETPKQAQPTPQGLGVKPETSGLVASSASEEQYIPASPEENLLPTDQPASQPDLGFWLDETTLSSLHEDLSSLEEGLGEQGSRYPVGDLNLESPELDLSDLMSDRSTSPLPEVTGTAETLDNFSLDDFATALPEEQLGLPDAVTQANIGFSGGIEGVGGTFRSSVSDTAQSLPQENVAAGNPAPFTLEGMDDLFADVPTVSAAPVPPPAVPTPTASSATTPTPFTLEGMDDLFADVPPVSAAPVPPPAVPTPTASSATTPAPFTLEGMDDLFADAPSVSTTSARSLSSESLQAISDSLFSEAPSDSPAIAGNALDRSSSGFMLQRFGDLFMEVPEVTDTSAGSGLMQPSAFTLEHKDGVFMEMPLVPGASQSANADTLPSEKKTGLT